MEGKEKAKAFELIRGKTACGNRRGKNDTKINFVESIFCWLKVLLEKKERGKERTRGVNLCCNLYFPIMLQNLIHRFPESLFVLLLY